MAVEDPINMKVWIDEDQSTFSPPVCNKLMYGAGQLKIMFVGGPNIRRDFHIDEAEEFFYMVKGDMVLKVMEKGNLKDVPIKEGEVFRLPSRVPHSPQRQAGTIGLVIERERVEGEIDGLRYYCDDNKTILYEEWFKVKDLVKDLPPVIGRYFASEQHKTGKPIPGTIAEIAPVKIDTTTEVIKPFNLKQWIDLNTDEIHGKGLKELFGNGEFQINVYGEGKQEDQVDLETWFWQLEGQVSVAADGKVKVLNEGDVLLIPQNIRYSVERQPKSVGITVRMDPTKNK